VSFFVCVRLCICLCLHICCLCVLCGCVCLCSCLCACVCAYVHGVCARVGGCVAFGVLCLRGQVTASKLQWWSTRSRFCTVTCRWRWSVLPPRSTAVRLSCVGVSLRVCFRVPVGRCGLCVSVCLRLPACVSVARSGRRWTCDAATTNIVSCSPPPTHCACAHVCVSARVGCHVCALTYLHTTGASVIVCDVICACPPTHPPTHYVLPRGAQPSTRTAPPSQTPTPRLAA
jgi:hypothetical protein